MATRTRSTVRALLVGALMLAAPATAEAQAGDRPLPRAEDVTAAYERARACLARETGAAPQLALGDIRWQVTPQLLSGAEGVAAYAGHALYQPSDSTVWVATRYARNAKVLAHEILHAISGTMGQDHREHHPMFWRCRLMER